MVSDKVFTTDGTQKIFSSDFSVISEDHLRVFLDGTVVSRDDYDLINNAAVFFTAPTSGQALTLQVGTTPGDILSAPTDAGIVAANITDVNDVANSITDVNEVQDNIADVNTVAANITDVNTVAGIDADVTTVATNDTNVTTVATNISSVNTVATNINDVITVANDLTEAISEVETVADDLNEAVSEIDTVANNITDVQTVGTNIADVNTVADDITNVNTTATDIANVNTTATNIANVNTTATNIADVNTVATNIGDVNTVEDSITNVNTVATDIANVNTTATNITDVNTVATNIADINTVEDSITNVDTVATDITNVNTVATDITNVNTTATNITDVNTVATDIANINTVATNITDVNTVADDLNEVISEIETVANDLNEQLSEIETVAASITNVDTVGTNISDVNTVATDISNVNTTATDIANVNTVATDITNVNTVATDITNVNTVATNISDVNDAYTNATNAAASAAAAATSESNAATSETNAAASETAAAASETAAATSETNAATSEANAATSETNAATSETNAAASESSASASATAAAASAANAALAYDQFDDRYLGSKSADPAVDNDGNALVVGALYFNTTDGVMKVYTSSGWVNASSSLAVTFSRFMFTATAGQTVFTGTDDNSETLTVAPDYVMVTLNGIQLEYGSSADFTATSSTITLTSGATAGDELNVYAFSPFEVADVYTRTQADAYFVSTTGNVSLTNKTIDDISNDIGADHVHLKVRNETGSTINAGVTLKVTGWAVGHDCITVAPCSTTGDVAIGMTYAALPTNTNAAVTNTGVIADINTSTYSVGNILYTTGNGTLTTTKPTNGDYQTIGYVLRSHSSEGVIFVEFTEPNGISLPDQTGHNGQFLQTDGTTADWATVNTDLVSDTTPQLGGNLDANGFTIDGRNVATDGTKLDGIESGATADQTKADIDALGINAATLDSIDSTSFLRSDTADTKTSGNLTFNDNVQAVFGTHSDLQIYHNGTHSILNEAGTGDLIIYTNGANFQVDSSAGENMLNATPNGAVHLYYDNSKKLETTSTGVSVTGDLSVSGSISGAGKVLQVVQKTKTNASTHNGSANTFAEYDSNFRLSITPTSASSKLLLTFSLSAAQNTGTIRFKIQRSTNGGSTWTDADVLGDANASHGRGHFAFLLHSDTNQLTTTAFTLLDNPATTSTIIYRVLYGQDVSTTYYFNRSPNYYNNFLGCTISSTIIAQEIGA